MKELRCPNNIKFGDLFEDFNGRPVLEVKCRSSRCGAASGVVVLHRFHAITGDLIETKMYAEPKVRKEIDGAQHNPVAVRHP